MNKTNFIHGAWAVAMQLIGYAIFANIWIGAAFAIGWFLSREYTQREYKLHIYGNYNLHWWQGFTSWNRDDWLDFLIPIIAVLIVGFFFR